MGARGYTPEGRGLVWDMLMVRECVMETEVVGDIVSSAEGIVIVTEAVKVRVGTRDAVL